MAEKDDETVIFDEDESDLDNSMQLLRSILQQDVAISNPTEVFSTSRLQKLDAASLELIIPLLKDPDERLVNRVIRYLVSLGEQAIPFLASALRDPERTIRARVIEVLGKIGSAKAGEVLVEYLSQSDGDLAMTVVEALKGIGVQCVSQLIDAFDLPNSKIKSYIAYALWEIGDQRATRKLVSALVDSDPDICGTAAVALGKIGGREVAEELAKALLTNDERIQDYKKQKDPRSFDFLAVQAHIATALVDVGEASVEILLPYLAISDSRDLFRSIISIVGKIGSKKATVSLLHIIDNYGELDSKLLIELIHATEGIADVRFVPFLCEILNSGNNDKNLLEATVKALRKIEGEDAKKAIFEALYHRESVVRFYAVIAIKQNGYSDAAEALLSLLEDPSPLVSAQAMNTLEKFANKALPMLFKEFSRHPNKRENVGKLIKRIGRGAIAKLHKGEDPQAEEILHSIVDFSVDGRRRYSNKTTVFSLNEGGQK